MEEKEFQHIPVLKGEVVKALNVSEGKRFIDCTFGMAGHTSEILKMIDKQGMVLAFEYDNELYEMMKEKFKSEKRLLLVNENFKNVGEVAIKKNFFPVDGIIVDLGIGSFQIERKKGFSFHRDEELDMRYNPKEQKIKAKDILNTFPEKELAKIFKRYGQIKIANFLARKIIENRPIETTGQLKRIIDGLEIKERKLLRRVFLALRLATNKELENLSEFLPQTIDLLRKGGRLAIITYHSLEERVIKDFLKKQRKFFKMVGKPILPSLKEILKNKKSRSAKLYVLEKK